VSKAFTKDDDGGEVIIAPRRAPLPFGVPNYVTPRGLSLLQAELSALGRVQPDVAEASELERARALQLHQARVSELESRIHGAIVVSPEHQPRDEVRFGAKVTVRSGAGAERTYRLVGVDEADAERGLLAFVSPLARALLGKRVGEVALVSTPAGEDELEIARILYE
jgi:transcription elongation factor GreB